MGAADCCGLVNVMIERNKSAARPVDVVAGNLQIRLAESEAEVAAAQALRYRVFYEGMGATPSAEMADKQRDFDRFDDYCDHLLVLDQAESGSEPAVVGTYRVMRREAASRSGRFYSSDEYDIGPLKAVPGEIMELGRSCVRPGYRAGAAMALLWRGIAEYSYHYKVEVMFGCASFPGIDPLTNRLPLAYLHHHHLAPPNLRARAIEGRYVDLSALAEAVDDRGLDEGRQLLPPLIKGYLRVGGYIGDGAVIDHDFGTTDVCIIVKSALLTEKYARHYRFERLWEGEADRQAG